jgi:hypothetical protein
LYITETALIAKTTFSAVKGYALILTKKGLGYILGDFLTNSSGHPVSRRVAEKLRV